MPVTCYDVSFVRLSADDLKAWQEIPAAVASDCLGRSHAMSGAISPLSSDMRIVAQACTVSCMVADNSALHAAISRNVPGDVVVCDAKSYEDSALFGGILTNSAIAHGVSGLVIDGAVRDTAEILEAKFPCFARATVPGGPHKGFGGVINGPISCGGIPVSPGDLIIGDADGVTVVPIARVSETLVAARAMLEKEERALASLANGGSIAEIYGVPDVTMIKP